MDFFDYFLNLGKYLAAHMAKIKSESWIILNVLGVSWTIISLQTLNNEPSILHNCHKEGYLKSW